jgi:chromatin remodeling complex protein RSC6
MPAVASHSNANTMASETKTVKKTATKKVAEPTPAPAAPAVAAPAPEPKKAARKTAAKTEVTVPVVENTPAPAAPAPAAATETAAAAAAPSFGAVAERLREVQTRLTTELKEVVREALAAAKHAAKEVKDAKKKQRRVKKSVEEMTPEEKAAWEARRANNAFLKPRAISPELCAFLGIEAGSQRSQTEVTKHVSQYVKSHGCFDPANKRRIIPDGALAKLLRVTDKDTVTYLNLQSYLKAHFLKA